MRCIDDGTVTEVTNDSYYGTTVKIEHIGGFTSVYKLMSDSNVQVGDVLLQGDVIGKISDTALEEIMDGPHLHLELYRDGKLVDPLEYIFN